MIGALSEVYAIRLRLRWIGHELNAETDLTVDATPSVSEAHAIAGQAEHRLIHEVPRLTRATVHTDPHGSRDAHDLLARRR